MPPAASARCGWTEKTASGASAFAEIVPILWLTPDDDALWRGPSQDRRRFFDQLVAAFEPGHVGNGLAYSQVMRQRLKLLKEAAAQNSTPDATWLDGLKKAWPGTVLPWPPPGAGC